MGTYINVSDVLAEGVDPSTPPGKIERRIAKWEALLHKLTGNIFYPYSPGELVFDGNNGSILWFSLPIISVSSLKINGETTEVATTEYRVGNGNSPVQDDRGNPYIELTGSRDTSLWGSSGGNFLRGLDQKITATWGYVEPGNLTPEPIKSALVQLVIIDLDNYFDKYSAGGGGVAVSPLKRERTDDHEREWQETAKQSVTWRMLPADIASILAIYRSPLAISAPDATDLRMNANTLIRLRY